MNRLPDLGREAARGWRSAPPAGRPATGAHGCRSARRDRRRIPPCRAGCCRVPPGARRRSPAAPAGATAPPCPARRRRSRGRGRRRCGSGRPRPCRRGRSCGRRSPPRSGRPAARRGRAGVPTWWTAPSFITTSRSAMVSASSWSWVTITVVRPSCCCSSRISTRTSWRSLASRLESGSSSSSTSGRMASARASATRCCWPPESWRGRRAPKPASRTSASASSTRLSMSALGSLRISRPKATFCATVRCGNSA